MKSLRLGTRASTLAMTQSQTVANALRLAHPDLSIEIVALRSSGDQKPDIALASAGGVGLFTNELEQALLSKTIDLAVHSLKDLPTQLAAGLGLAAISAREDWRDAWVSAKYQDPWTLPQGALVGTGSPRRRAQLSARRPDLKFVEFRGNVDTRLAKLERGEVDGAVLAMAGLKRLGLTDTASYLFGASEMLPAPGQGFLGLETRLEDEAYDLVSALNVALASDEAEAERAVLARLGAGCHTPVAALAQSGPAGLELQAWIKSSDGMVYTAQRLALGISPKNLGSALAEDLLRQGARV